MTVHDLARRFNIDGSVAITEGKGGLAMIDITTDHATALVSPYGGQVLSFRPKGGEDLLFLSESAYYAPGKAIKGGMPVCWPWFGPDPEGKGRPGHGFMRNRLWDVLSTEVLADGRIRVCLGLTDNAETHFVWPHSFGLRLEVTIGEALDVALVTRNSGTAPFDLTQALHTYFRIGDIARTRVLGLEDCRYIDKMDGGAEKVQDGAVTITGETDRIYTGVTGKLRIDDEALGRRILIDSTGSASAVVWNPWQATAKAMADLGDDDYQRMICVETTNAGPDIIHLAPGAEHRLTVCYLLS